MVKARRRSWSYIGQPSPNSLSLQSSEQGSGRYTSDGRRELQRDVRPKPARRAYVPCCTLVGLSYAYDGPKQRALAGLWLWSSCFVWIFSTTAAIILLCSHFFKNDTTKVVSKIFILAAQAFLLPASVSEASHKLHRACLPTPIDDRAPTQPFLLACWLCTTALWHWPYKRKEWATYWRVRWLLSWLVPIIAVLFLESMWSVALPTAPTEGIILMAMGYVATPCALFFKAVTDLSAECRAGPDASERELLAPSSQMSGSKMFRSGATRHRMALDTNVDLLELQEEFAECYDGEKGDCCGCGSGDDKGGCGDQRPAREGEVVLEMGGCRDRGEGEDGDDEAATRVRDIGSSFGPSSVWRSQSFSAYGQGRRHWEAIEVAPSTASFAEGAASGSAAPRGRRPGASQCAEASSRALLSPLGPSTQQVVAAGCECGDSKSPVHQALNSLGRPWQALNQALSWKRSGTQTHGSCEV